MSQTKNVIFETRKPRLQINDLEPEAFKAMFGLEGYLANTGLNERLKTLIKMKASQVNHCAFCIDMHSDHAVQQGESHRRLLAISAWEESALFSPEERAVLRLTEELTQLSEGGLQDSTYDICVELLGEKTLAQCMMQIATINAWNRIALASRMLYQPA